MLTSFENMKSKHLSENSNKPQINLKSSASIESTNYNKKLKKSYFGLNGKKIGDYLINDSIKNKESSRVKVNNIKYNDCNLKEFISQVNKETARYNESSISNLFQEENTHGYRNLKPKSSMKDIQSKADLKLYKDIFDRPIIFKDINNNEYKITNKEYDIMSENNLLDNCEQDENKMLIINKKSWLVKGVIDHLYPKVMIIRTNLIRKGVIKK